MPAGQNKRRVGHLKAKVSALEAAKFPQGNRLAATTFLTEELSLEDISEMVDAWAEQAQNRLQHALENGAVTSIVVPVPTEAVATLMAEFDTRIGQLAAMEDAEGRAKLEHEKRALDERLKLADIREDVVAQIERLRSLAALKEVAKTTARRPSTNKNKELSERLVTGALRDRFAREIDKLRLNSNPLELRKTRDSKGQSYFKVEFVKFPGQPLGDILSEGEHRCVALAAFLAELVTSREYSGIVFDDPMSSLDHVYRVRVARRLVEEAQHRQVVVFTHRMTGLAGRSAAKCGLVRCPVRAENDYLPSRRTIIHVNAMSTSVYLFPPAVHGGCRPMSASFRTENS